MPRISSLHVYPIKSCAGLAVQRWKLLDHGLAWDREWMLVDSAGRFVSQRTVPAMARVLARLEGPADGERDGALDGAHDGGLDAGARDENRLAAAPQAQGVLHVSMPGLAPLRVPLRRARRETLRTVGVWRDSMLACDEGDAAADWFCRALGTPVRLVRFASSGQRWASRDWVGPVDVPCHFADGFPLLLTNESSLRDLNARLRAKGAPAIPMDRFRANVVLADWDAYEEDYATTLGVAGGAVLRLVKPCARCPIPGIDQQTGLRDPAWPHEPNDTLATYRTDPRVGGGVTFGQNAVVERGAPGWLAVGAEVEVTLDFGD